MKTAKDESMKKLIEGWGLPKCFQNRNEEVVFKFDDKGIKNTNEEGYFVRDGDVKFCIFEPATGSVLFSMDFFKISPTHNGIPSAINLELVYVHQESLRKNGIASYFIQKLIQYAILENMEFIKVKAMADAENFKDDTHINALSQDELEAFYRKFDSPEMPIKVCILEIYE